MPYARVSSIAVLVAHDVNLSIFKPLWLTHNEILLESEISDDYVISPAVVKIATQRFELMILPNRVQMRFHHHHRGGQADLLRVIGGIVDKLPHTPYTAVGLNHEFVLTPPAGQVFADWNKELYRAPCAALLGREPTDRFGTYFSFNALGMRAKVTALPTTARDGMLQFTDIAQPGDESMQYSFNFHADLDDPPDLGNIRNLLGSWEATIQKAEDVVIAHEQLAEGGSNDL